MSSDNFFTDGTAYERLMGRWSQRVGQDFLTWLSTPPRLRWIDIGCGTGVFTAELMKRADPSYVLGIDPAADQIAFARRRPELAEVDLRVGDAQALPSEDDSFDAAVMALVIHFVPNPSKAIAEMARVVRPGGLAASYVWDYSIGGSPRAPLDAALNAFGIPTPHPPSARATSLQASQELWRSAGFASIETRVIEIEVSFDSFEDYWASMSVPVGPAGKVIADMSPDTLDRFRRFLQERTPLTAAGQVRYGATANAIKGRR